MLRRLTLAIALSAACLIPAGSASARNLNDPDRIVCDNAGSHIDISACLEAEFKAADAQLNDVYAAIIGVWRSNPAKNDDEKRLRAAQHAWIAYRDMACDAEAGLYNGGSGKGLVLLACLTALTDQRTEALRRGFWWQVEKFR